MRMAATFCLCALFAATLFAFEPFGWTRGKNSQGAFSWHEPLAAGKTLSLRNLNGPIRVEPSAGAEAEVTATVSWERSDPKAIRFLSQPEAGGVTICALWPGQEGDCTSAKGDVQSNDLDVTFVVRLPRGVALDAATVNGDVTARGVGAGLRVATVNGQVDVDAAAAPVRVETVNGGINARVGAVVGAGELHFSTVNGDVNVQVPAPFDAEVSARTVAGRISILGHEYRERVRTTVGKGGGRKLSAQTVNGSIAVR
jgi:hypothetical protein